MRMGMNISTTTNIGTCLPNHPRLRVCRPWCLRPRISPRVAIRLGPDVIELHRERRIGRVLNRVDAGDRFAPHRDAPPVPLEPNRGDTFEENGRESTRAKIEQSIARLERELNRVEGRLSRAKLELGGVLGSIARHRFDEPVAYAYRWNPDLSRAGSPPPTVVHVPGIVRSHVSPLGRLVDVSM